MASLTLHNALTNKTRTVPVGFSWTTLLFGAIPLLFRSEWKWFIICTLIASLTFNLSSLVFMFMINKIHISELINDGYRAVSYSDGTLKDAELKLGISLVGE